MKSKSGFSNMIEKKIFIILLLSIAILSIAGCSRTGRGEIPDGDAYVPVKVEQIQPSLVRNTLQFNGILAPIQEAAIGPQLSAWVKKIYVEEGDRVKKGRLLVVLDDTQVRQARAQYEAAKKEYERIKSLHETGTVTQQQFDRVEAAYIAAEAAYELAGSNTNIRAPFNGVVDDVNVEVGEAFSPMVFSASGKPSLLSVLKDDSMKVELRVSDAQLPQIEVGQKALVKIDAFPDTLFEGKVINMEPAASRASGTFKAVVGIPNKDRKLRAGLFARVFVVIQELDSALAVPQDAIVGDTLIFLARGEKARASKIKLIFQTETEAVLESGIQTGDSVIVDGLIGLFNGADIRVTE